MSSISLFFYPAIYLLVIISSYASFQDDVAIFRNQMRYDAAFVNASLEKLQVGYQLLHHNLPMIGSEDSNSMNNIGRYLPDASSIADIYSAIEFDGNNIGRLRVYVVFKKDLPRQNIAHLITNKSIRYTALDPNGQPMAFTGSDKGKASSITSFSCERLTRQSESKFASSMADNEFIDLVYFLPYPFNYCR